MNQQVQACQCANCPGAGCQCGCQHATPAGATPARQACACGPACQCGPGCQCDAAESGCVCNG